MEFPEKLYIENRMHPYSYLTACKDIMRDDDIEYTRTDAFVEKAANWLRCHPSSNYNDLEEFANAFKKAMKLYDKRECQYMES